MEKWKTFDGLVGILAGAGLGLIGVMSGGCMVDKTVYSESYPMLQCRPEIKDKEHGVGVPINISNDKNSFDILAYKDKPEVFLRMRTGSLYLEYFDDTNFSVSTRHIDMGDNFRKIYPLEAYVSNPHNWLNNEIASNDDGWFKIKGKDILDNTGKLKQRIFEYSSVVTRQFQRTEDFDEQGIMTRASITDKTAGKEIYVLEWNKKNKDYDVKLNSLDKKFTGK